jgi:hypothetical protein
VCALPYRKREKAMLKISLLDGRTQRRLVLEGKVIGPWAAELRTAYQKTRADLNGRELVIDLKHITAINQEGEDVLFELMSEGVKFCGRGVFTKQILKQVASRARKSLQQRKR